MIYVNKPISFKGISYIVCDFDQTITTTDSTSSWGIYSESSLLSEDFKQALNDCYNKYRPIELNHQIPLQERIKLLCDWPREEISHFAEFGINIDLFRRIARETNALKVRPGFTAFIEETSRLQIPVFIVSGGLFEPIEGALKRAHALTPNVSIITNTVRVVNDKIVGLEEPVIHTHNKNTIKLPLQDDERGVLFGDLPSDKNVSTHLKTINIGFLNKASLELYKREFDIVLTDGSSFDGISKILFKQYKK